MNCTRPILALDFGIDETTGKHRIKLLPKRADMNIDSLRARYGDMLMLLPCGTCLACRTSRSKDWSNRLFLESLEHEKNYFITLTYDNNHCPRELVKSDVQEFLKSLRNNGFKLRYFVAGEYGEITKRPHYHMLTFGLDIPDLDLFNVDEENRKYYTSEFISSYWNKGNVLISEMTPETICYTARYCTKKLGSDDYKKEFILMSRRPGIGSHYIESHLSELIDDKKIYCGEFGIKGFSRYINNFIKSRYPEAFEMLASENKKLAHDKMIHNRIRYRTFDEKLLMAHEDFLECKEARKKARDTERI